MIVHSAPVMCEGITRVEGADLDTTSGITTFGITIEHQCSKHAHGWWVRHRCECGHTWSPTIPTLSRPSVTHPTIPDPTPAERSWRAGRFKDERIEDAPPPPHSEYRSLSQQRRVYEQRDTGPHSTPPSAEEH